MKGLSCDSKQNFSIFNRKTIIKNGKSGIFHLPFHILFDWDCNNSLHNRSSTSGESRIGWGWDRLDKRSSVSSIWSQNIHSRFFEFIFLKRCFCYSLRKKSFFYQMNYTISNGKQYIISSGRLSIDTANC